MNILLVHPHDLFSRAEPWTVRIKNIAKELSKRGNEVKLCYFPLVIGNHSSSQTEFGELIPLDRTPSPKVFLKNIYKLVQLAKEADVVHIQKCHHYASIPAVIAAFIARKPLHYDWDDWEEKIWYESCGRGLHSRFIGASFKLLERWLPVLADSVSCASSHLKDMSRKFGVKENYIFDAPVGADLEKFRLDIDGQWVRDKYGIEGGMVLYIGQLHGAQYVDILIRAANIVLHKSPHLKFLIVGEGFLMNELQKQVFDLGLEEKVIFAGAIPHEEVPFYIAAADICVAPFKYTEVTRCKSPLKIIEYMAVGKIVVASCVGEVRNMLGGCGILVEPGSHKALAEGILLAWEKKAEIKDKIRERARKRIEQKYNWRYTAGNILDAYKKIVESL